MGYGVWGNLSARGICGWGNVEEEGVMETSEATLGVRKPFEMVDLEIPSQNEVEERNVTHSPF